MAAFQTVKGFRDFYPEDCAIRNYIFTRWREVAARFGFAEYEGPMLESTELYKKKSGDEITTQLFNFLTKGEEDVSLRPEVTPTLARMAAAKHRQYPKVMKWFQMGPCFRYERPQRGRLREFYQFNVDILGEDNPAADAELVAFTIESLRIFGLKEGDFSIRLSDRRLWAEFQSEYKLSEEQNASFLQIIDKLERTPEDVTDTKLQALGVSLVKVREFIAGITPDHPIFAALRTDLEARGLWDFVKIDPSIVRGLAYYTGTVFEAFDLKHNLRAIAGGGRYDNLVGHLSEGAASLPACGYAMGDVVLGELIKQTPEALQKMNDWTANASAMDAYVVVADETKRAEALRTAQLLREHGFRVSYGLTPQKVGKQFQAAEAANARFAVVVGAEYPVLGIKNLRTRDQLELPMGDLTTRLAELLAAPEYGRLIA